MAEGASEFIRCPNQKNCSSQRTRAIDVFDGFYHILVVCDDCGFSGWYNLNDLKK